MNPIELAQARATAASELARIDADIAAINSAARADRIAEVRALMAEHGLTAADLGRLSSVKAVKAKAEPMYQNEFGLTWAGRGKRPKWLGVSLAAGRTLESFRIGV